MTEKVIDVVFDCNVFLQAAANPDGPAGTCKKLVDKGALKLFISPEILAEVEGILRRPKVRERFATLTEELITAFLEDILSVAVMVEDVPQRFTFTRDPKDAPYLNLAIAASAAYLVSRDSDLLDLMIGHTQECKEFRQRFRPLKVVDPVTFLRELSEKSDDPEQPAS
ncbi:MAG TPA: putative toxin-antitoxin system toxin component, PIN family [Blastocatellia bacterium]|nr:putative toxin-antitoxin system toxin component, PIN family [Blastocatellia bacterium]